VGVLNSILEFVLWWSLKHKINNLLEITLLIISILPCFKKMNVALCNLHAVSMFLCL
jgi:hypothetical protein